MPVDEIITDDMLWENAMSREVFEAAFNSVSAEQFERMVANVDAKRMRRSL